LLFRVPVEQSTRATRPRRLPVAVTTTTAGSVTMRLAAVSVGDSTTATSRQGLPCRDVYVGQGPYVRAASQNKNTA
jgi:hypothetical protein